MRSWERGKNRGGWKGEGERGVDERKREKEGLVGVPFTQQQDRDNSHNRLVPGDLPIWLYFPNVVLICRQFFSQMLALENVYFL